MDIFNPSTWKQQWETLMRAPFIIVPLLAIVAFIAWWFRGRIGEAAVAGLIEQIKAFEARLQLAAERSAWANEAKDDVIRQFKDYKSEVETNAGTGKGALAALAAKVDAAIEKFSDANNAVRHAVGIAVGVSSSVSIETTVIRADKDSRNADAP